MRKNVANQKVAAQLVSLSDGSNVTSGTTTVYVTIDDGVQTSIGTATHKGNGCWTVDTGVAANTNGNHLAFTWVNSSAVSVTSNVYTIGYDPQNADLGNDWSTAEKNQIRHRLQIDGTQVVPSDLDYPAVNVMQVLGTTVEETGVIDANVAQLNGNAAAAAVLKLFADVLDQATGQLDSGTFNLSIDGKTFVEALQIIAATCAGQTSGAGSGTEIYYGLDKTTPRVQVGITAGVGTTKERSAVDYL